jgi:hypothetical protein
MEGARRKGKVEEHKRQPTAPIWGAMQQALGTGSGGALGGGRHTLNAQVWVGCQQLVHCTAEQGGGGSGQEARNNTCELQARVAAGVQMAAKRTSADPGSSPIHVHL